MRRRFWLDGGGSVGARSLVGELADDDVSLVLQEGQVIEYPSGRVVGEDIFAALEERLDGDRRTHWVGCFGYAASPAFPARSMPGVPDAVWMRTNKVSHHANLGHQATAVSRPAAHPAAPADYREAFDQVQENLAAGNSYEVNLTYREFHDSTRSAEEIHQRLRSINPAPYSGMLQHGDTWLLSASPERYATVDRRRRVETRPIKGTTPRGADQASDQKWSEELQNGEKFRAENLMIVDLLRNDLAMVCQTGTVQVTELMQVESYAAVHQLVSTVEGHLRPEVSTINALQALFPAGSMTGAPKRRTMEIIDEVEATPRGFYAGAFGWISGDGRADLGVVIRSLFKGPQTQWILGTGGGITVDSDVDEEWAESLWKAARVRAAL